MSNEAIRVQVIEEDAIHARASNCTECLVARALKRHFNSRNVAVIVYSAIVNGLGYNLNPRASVLIQDFDNGIKIEYPVEIELTLQKGQQCNAANS